MTQIEAMWAALTAYQPQADAAGHGESWAKMCREKTTTATAYDAYDAATYAAAAYAAAATYATYAAATATATTATTDDVKMWAQKAIKEINDVLIEPAPSYETNT